MGISNTFHFAWLEETIKPIRAEIRESLPKKPLVLGIGENEPSQFLIHLLDGMDYKYQACDLFPLNDKVVVCDINDLSPLFGKVRADVVCILRSSMFIKNKHSFFLQLKKLLAPNAYLFMDLLIGSSTLPVLDFRYADRRSLYAHDPDRPEYFQSSFFDDRLLQEFRAEVDAFCQHARRWPLETQIKYLRRSPKFFFRDAYSLRGLTPENLGDSLHEYLPEQSIFSLKDIRDAGFEILGFGSRYFYPYVKKFSLYNFIAARYRAGN
ncbi:MAG: hypothetical protein KIS85_00020 [Anaerolineales bacterium]|nr:hypothetical protein [Anaerolineales bacterium]